jgi:hypothetical protein
MKKIVLIGDSIRKGYDKYVKMAFDEIAEIFYPRENCRFTGYILRCLLDWKNEMKCGDDVDLIHWNAGLWDDLVMLDGKNLTPIAYYKENIQRICDSIKILFPKAKMIFATSTPIQEELFLGPCKRYNADTEKYNEQAIEIIKSNNGKINDLYSLVKGCPKDYYSDLTHLYTKQGTQLITEQVIRVIEESLQLKAKKLNYSELFSNEVKIEGI